VLILDMIEVLSPLGKYKYDTLRILLMKYYIDNSMCLRSYIRNVNSWLRHHRLAHVGMRNLHKLLREGNVLGLMNVVFDKDRPC
jgi:hypothetical protein